MSNLSVSQAILTLIADRKSKSSDSWNGICSYISAVLTASNLAFADKNVMQRRISSASINVELIDTFRTIIPEDALKVVEVSTPILIKLWESLAQYHLAEEFKTLVICDDAATSSIGESKLSRVPGHSLYVANAELEYILSLQAFDIVADSFRLIKDPIFSVPLAFIPIGFPVKSHTETFFCYASNSKTDDYRQALFDFASEVYILCWGVEDKTVEDGGYKKQIERVNESLRNVFTLLISLYEEEIQMQLSNTIATNEDSK